MTNSSILGAEQQGEPSERGCCDFLLTGISVLLAVLFFPISWLFCIKVRPETQYNLLSVVPILH